MSAKGRCSLQRGQGLCPGCLWFTCPGNWPFPREVPWGSCLHGFCCAQDPLLCSALLSLCRCCGESPWCRDVAKWGHLEGTTPLLSSSFSLCKWGKNSQCLDSLLCLTDPPLEGGGSTSWSPPATQVPLFPPKAAAQSQGRAGASPTPKLLKTIAWGSPTRPSPAPSAAPHRTFLPASHQLLCSLGDTFRDLHPF